MDFYKELLESFSRVKGRKLRLLEETKESEGEFQVRVGRAVTEWNKSIWPGLQKNPGKASFGYSYKPSSGQPGTGVARQTPGFGSAIWDGKTFSPNPGSNDPEGTFKQLIGSLAPKTAKATSPDNTGKRKKNLSDPSDYEEHGDISAELVEQYPIDEETKTKVVGLFKKIGIMAKKVYDSWMFQGMAKARNAAARAAGDEAAATPEEERTPEQVATLARARRASEPFDQSDLMFATYLRGKSPQSFQQKLVAPKSSLLFEGGVWEKQDYSLDAVQLAGITESYHDLLNLISNNRIKCDSVASRKVMEKFSKTPNGNVIIRPKTGDKNQALSFADDTGQMKNLLDLAELKCPDLKVRKEVIKAPLGGGGSDNAVRGLGFEKILELVSLISMNKATPNDVLQGVIDFKIGELTRRLQTLRSEVERWVHDSKWSAMKPEDLAIAESIVGILKAGMIGASEGSVGEEAESLFTRMIEHSKEAMRVRRPLVFLPVGDQVGGGKRQDILEIYSSVDEAVKAAKRSGIQIAEGDIKCGAARSFFIGVGKTPQESDAATLDALDGAGILKKEQEVCTLKVSLKNYMSLDWAKYGGGRYSTFKGLMTGEDDNPDFLSTIATNLRIPDPQEETLDANGDPIPTELDELKAYASEMDLLGKEVFDIPLEVLTTGADGNPIAVGSGEITARALIDTLRQKSSYDEFTGSSNEYRDILEKPVAARSQEEKDFLAEVEDAPENENDIDDLIRQAEIVAGGTGITNKEREIGFYRLKLLLNDRFQSVKLRQDIAAGGPLALKAKRFIAARMYHSGGSDDNDLICDYRDLIKNLTYIFKQNDPLNDAWGSVLSGGKDSKGNVWTMEIANSGMVSLRSGGMTLRLKSDVKSTRAGGVVTGTQQSFNTEVNRAVMEYYSKNEGPPEIKPKSKKEESTLGSIMDTLLEVIGALKGKISVRDLQKII